MGVVVEQTPYPHTTIIPGKYSRIHFEKKHFADSRVHPKCFHFGSQCEPIEKVLVT